MESVSITLSNNENSLNIENLLEGDSLVENFIWKEYDSKKVNLGWYVNKGCLFSPYIINTQDLIYTLNNKTTTLKWARKYDFLFWLDRNDIREVKFSPDQLKIKIITIDSTGFKRQQFTDSIKIKSL